MWVPDLQTGMSRSSSAVSLTLRGHLSDLLDMRAEAGSAGNAHPKPPPAGITNH